MKPGTLNLSILIVHLFSLRSLFYSCWVRGGLIWGAGGQCRYFLYFQCFLVLSQQSRPDPSRWQPSPMSLPGGAGAEAGAEKGLIYVFQNKSSYNLKILHLSLEEGHSRIWKWGQGQCHSVQESCMPLLWGGCSRLDCAGCIVRCLYKWVGLIFFPWCHYSELES